MSLRNIISRNKNDIAFLIGNGINRYQNNLNLLSWDDLLIDLLKKYTDLSTRQIPKGISTTEFYDILELKCIDGITRNYALQKEVVNRMSVWQPQNHHTQIVKQIASINAPLLTTNFDLILPQALNLKKKRILHKGFTHYYPWSDYFSNNDLTYPTDGFGIWFLNGMIKYYTSIRLGLTHYMGSVERARKMIHNGPDNLFKGKSQHDWPGCKTWLHIIFNKSLCIFGLALEENEVFIRWLLIERAKYFKKYSSRQKNGWYVYKKPSTMTDNYKGKLFFMKQVGLEIIEVDSYDEIYKTPWES